MYNSETLKQNVKQLLNKKNMSEKQLADCTNLSLNTVRAITAGKANNPTIQNLMAIAGILECSLDKMLGYEVTSSLGNQPLNKTFMNAALDVLHEEIAKQDKEVSFFQWCDGLEQIYASIVSASELNKETILQKKPSDT